MAKLNATLSFDLDTYAGVDNETLVIDARTREIYIPDPENVFGVQYDKDSKYVKFKVVNEVSEVFKMEDALIRINYRDSKGIIGSSLAVDKVTDYDTCEFSWIVPNNALKNKGDLYFVVSAVVVDEDGIIQKRWSTTLSRVVTPESIYSKSPSLDQNERDEIAMLLLLVSEKCNQAIEDIGEARDTGITTITNIKDSGIEELNDLISKYGIRFEDLNVLKSRIDQLFDSGNLPGSNTEVTDIRIGYDGKTYSTAGNAVRIQISNIMEMILENNFYTPLLIDRDFELIDEENNVVQADWKYKVDGNQDLNGGSDNVGDSGNIAYELESLRNQMKFELKQIKSETSGLKENLVANSKEDAKTKRSLSALWDLNKGISYRFETDSEKAYQKKVMSGAKLASINKVGGKIIAWNQMFNYEDIKSVTVEGITFTNNGDGTYTANGTSTGVAYISNMINIIKGHMYYIRSLTTVGSDATYKAYITGSSTFNKLFDYGSGAIDKAQNSGNAYFMPLYIIKGVTVNELKIVPQVYDLTKIFGSGNEPSTPEELEAMFPNDYYPYNEGELMSMSVNDVIEKGRNLCDCYGFSSKPMLHINDKRELSNDYGTSISTIEPDNKVIVTQTQAPDSYTTASSNGFFYIGIKGMTPTKSYTLSFDFTPTKMLIESNLLLILVNGIFPSSPVSTGELNVKKRVAFKFEYKAVDDRQFLEIRLSGMSGVFENFQLDAGDVETAYTPYYTPISHSIPQSIQNLDGYGWSAGTVYNYVDFENKKFYKCVDRVDLGKLSFSINSKEDSRTIFTTILKDMKPNNGIASNAPNFTILNYRVVQQNASWNPGDISWSNSKPSIFVIDSANVPLEEFKEKINGEMLYYELAKPIVIDISEFIGDTFQEPFEVENGGSLTFKNTNGDGYQIAVPSDIQYVVSLSEVNS